MAPPSILHGRKVTYARMVATIRPTKAEVNQAVRTECAEVVLVNYFIRDAGLCNFHVLIAGHGCAIVEILDI